MTRFASRSTWCAPLLAISLIAGAGCGSSAPPLDVAESVDLSRFQGKWYEIARLPRSTEADCNGTTAFYTQGSGSSMTFVNQCNLGSATGPLYTVSMTVDVPDQTVPAKLALDVAGFTGDYWILEVGQDYEYAVVGHPSRLYWWVLSRTPTLDATTMQGVLARATASAFDVSQIEYTPQPPGTERAALATPEGQVAAPLHTGCAVSDGSLPRRGLTPWGVLLLLGLARRRSRARQPRRTGAGAGAGNAAPPTGARFPTKR
jgi:apolipoprotein D and lipocalin family protein